MYRAAMVLASAGALLIAAHPLAARVQKKVHGDGTLEYYNTSDAVVSPTKVVRRQFTSAYDPIIEELSATNGVDPYLVKCIIRVESNFNPNAVSPAGAMGLMQIMMEIAKYYDCADPMEPRSNLKAGIKHFAFLMEYFKGDVPLALAAYHAGLGRVARRMAVPPIKTTIAYVNDIMYLYSGRRDAAVPVKKLYKKIEKDGTIIIFSR